MLDIKLIRNDPEVVREALSRRGAHATAALDELLELDRSRRELLMGVEERRGLRNSVSEEIAKLKMPDLNTEDLQAAIQSVLGAARSMGVEVG